MNNSFNSALETGKVVVRRFWYNDNSEKDQVTVQFFQQIKKPETDNSSLLAIAQGISDSQTVSALYSFKADIAKAIFGNTEGSFVESGTPVFANDIFQTDVNIEVTENFTANPFSSNHEPKINPSTGEVVVAFNPETNQDDAIYRHTELVTGKADHTFISASSSAIAAGFGGVPKFDLSSILKK